MASTSSAYDFSLFEAKAERSSLAAAPAPKAAPKKKKSNVIQLNEQQLRRSHRHSAHSFRMMLNLSFVLVLVGAIGAIVFSQVQLTELTDQITTVSEALSEQQSLSVQLEMMAASKMNTDEVEAYARDRLGMEKVSDGQVSYISLAQDDAGTVVQKDHGPNFLESIWESILSIFS
ncbi:MAG: hypothetical protein ACI4GO_09470 [Hominenteromicrobium sp.]